MNQFKGPKKPQSICSVFQFLRVNTPIMIGFKLLGVDWLAKVLNIQQSALSGRYKPFQHNVGWKFDLAVMVMDSSPLGIIKTFLKT